MMDSYIYLKSRKIALVITVLMLLLGAIVYFNTDIARRNNEMMYKEIYGENATLNVLNVVDTVVNTDNNIQNAKIRLV